MMNPKVLVVGLGLLAAGVAAGWNASRMTDARVAAPSQAASDVQERASGDLTPQQEYRPAPTHRSAPVRHVARTSRFSRGITIPAGTPVAVSVSHTLSSKTAYVGQAWSGVVAEPVYRNGRVVIPAGSTARGTVVAARPAQRGERATLQLALSSLNVAGRSYRVRGRSEAVVAGSPRARNIGAIAGGTAAGALIGRAVEHGSKGTWVGAAVGGGAATAAVAASKGYQATIPAGRELRFTTSQSVRVVA